MADWSELKRLAEAAAEIESWYEERDFYAGGISEMELDIVRSSDRDFIIATSPAAILALIAENERLQGLACAVNSAMHEAGMSVGADPAELADVIHRLQAQVATLQSSPDSWQSGYDKGRSDGTKTRLSELEQERQLNAELRAEVESLRGSCKALGRENTLLTRRAKKAERAVLWFSEIKPSFLRPKWLVAVIDGLKGGRTDG